MNVAPVAVYELNAWEGFLLPHLLPPIQRIRAHVGEPARNVIERLSTEARGFAFHVNLSFSDGVPPDRALLLDELDARGIGSINAAVTDISKGSIQRLCRSLGLPTVVASPDGDPDEVLIVKTNLNYGGIPERMLSPLERHQAGVPLFVRRPHDYTVAPRSEIEDAMWTFPDLVIERFVTNAQHRFHRVYVAGASMVVSQVYDSALLKKMPAGIRRESWYFVGGLCRSENEPNRLINQIAADCGRFAQAALLDFGAIDIVSDDAGTAYIIDVNPTPYWGSTGHSDLLTFLADGLTAALAVEPQQ